MAGNNEQWKDGGDCGKCRRVTYCKKQCTANKKLCAKLRDDYIRQKRAAMILAKNEKKDQEDTPDADG